MDGRLVKSFADTIGGYDLPGLGDAENVRQLLGRIGLGDPDDMTMTMGKRMTSEEEESETAAQPQDQAPIADAAPDADEAAPVAASVMPGHTMSEHSNKHQHVQVQEDREIKTGEADVVEGESGGESFYDRKENAHPHSIEAHLKPGRDLPHVENAKKDAKEAAQAPLTF